jgi:hypothetical protein
MFNFGAFNCLVIVIMLTNAGVHVYDGALPPLISLILAANLH